MAFEPARPRYTLPFAGKDYELLGTMEVIEAIEAAMHDGIIQVWVRCTDMGVTDTAKLLSAVLTACGHKGMTPRAVADAIFATGINTNAFVLLKVHLGWFLRIVLEPPELREEAAKRAGEAMAGLTAPPDSPGENTSNSA